MSSKHTLFLQGGIIVLLLMTIGVGGYFLSTSQKQIDNSIEEQKKISVKIIRDIENLSKVNDERYKNATEQRDTQLEFLINQHDEQAKNILGNLSDHRIVSNETRDLILNAIK